METLRASWLDPEEKQRRIALIHTKESDKKRKESLQKYHQEHPEFSQKFTEKGQKRHQENCAVLMEKLLGDSPKETLNNMYWEQKLSSEKIGERLGGISGERVIHWMRKLEIGRRPRGRRGSQIKEECQTLVKEAVESGFFGALSSRRQQILTLRYLQEKPLTLEEIGQKRGVTRQDINSIEKKSLQELELLRNRQLIPA